MKISSQKKQSEKEFDELIKDFLEEYKNIYFADINNKFLYLAKLVITFLELGTNISNTSFNNLIKYSS